MYLDLLEIGYFFFILEGIYVRKLRFEGFFLLWEMEELGIANDLDNSNQDWNGNLNSVVNIGYGQVNVLLKINKGLQKIS